MPALSNEQFAHIDAGLTQMDKDYPHPAAAKAVAEGGKFFHGTTRAIKDGMVRPADDAGKPVSDFSMGDPGDMSEGDHAFVTKDEDYAWHAANTFHKNGMRPRVYETGPAADMKPGPWNKDHPDFYQHHEIYDEPDFPMTADEKQGADDQHQPEFASPTGFPVRKRIDIMPGRQGTFPEFNWNRFHEDGHRHGGADLNHPTDTAIQTPLHEQVKMRDDAHLQQQVANRAEHAGRQVRGLRGDRTHVLPIVPGKRPATLFD